MYNILDQHCIFLLLIILGFYTTIFKFILPLFFIIKIHFKSISHYLNLYGKNSYVLVTGATDGIGLGFCQEFAKLGFNIILISRNQQKLQKVEQQLQTEFKVQTKIVLADFLQQSENLNFYQKIHDQVKHLDISIIVNNVGTSYGVPFQNITEQEIYNQIILNSYPMIFMTKLFLNDLSKRKNSSIINVSSITAEIPMPYGAVYSGSKALEDYFSRALTIENSKFKNIKILTLRPLAVKTPLTRNVDRIGAINPNQCALGAIKYLDTHFDVTYGHISHSLQGFLISLTPSFLLNYLYSKQTKQFFEYCKYTDQINQQKKKKSN